MTSHILHDILISSSDPDLKETVLNMKNNKNYFNLVLFFRLLDYFFKLNTDILLPIVDYSILIGLSYLL